MVKDVHFADVEPICKIASDYAKMGNDYIVCRVESAKQRNFSFPGPTKMQCLTICFVRNGHIEFTIDQTRCRLDANSLMVLGHHNVVEYTIDESEDLVLDMLFVSKQFLQDLNFDFSAINLHSFVENRPSPKVPLSPDEVPLVESYFPILMLNAKRNHDALFSKNIGRSQVQSLIYQMLQLRANHIDKPVASDSGSQSRQSVYVQEFMRQLQVHHTRQRSISFYAERLCISPKYLSHLVKEATGRSATEWIAEMVVQEAKNQLRFSHKNIQQVAYALNFSTQSSFGKYFKHVTGMSPTEYQKT